MSMDTAVLVSMGIGIAFAVGSTIFIYICARREAEPKRREIGKPPLQAASSSVRLRRMLISAWSATPIALVMWAVVPPARWTDAIIFMLLGFAFGATACWTCQSR